MKWPEQLYAPTPKDRVGSFNPQRVGRAFTNTLAAGGISTAIYAVPGDQVLVLERYWLHSVAGAGQFPVIIVVSVLDQNANQTTIDSSSPFSAFNAASAAAGELILRGDPDIVVMPTERVFINATFNAAGVANFLEAAIFGVLYPRANWQLG